MGSADQQPCYSHLEAIEMADPKAEKADQKIEETGVPSQDGELSEADFERVSGGFALPNSAYTKGPSCTDCSL
jgi:hypothetical protein